MAGTLNESRIWPKDKNKNYRLLFFLLNDSEMNDRSPAVVIAISKIEAISE